MYLGMYVSSSESVGCVMSVLSVLHILFSSISSSIIVWFNYFSSMCICLQARLLGSLLHLFINNRDLNFSHRPIHKPPHLIGIFTQLIFNYYSPIIEQFICTTIKSTFVCGSWLCMKAISPTLCSSCMNLLLN